VAGNAKSGVLGTLAAQPVLIRPPVRENRIYIPRQ
jgi:hypothetical protein